MIPLEMREHRFLSQPLWVQNITTHDVKLTFENKDHNMHLINRRMTIPPQSVWPLIVQYRPSDFENNVIHTYIHISNFFN